MTLRRPEAEDFLDLAQQFRARRFGDPDSPVALYIGMAPDGTYAGAGPAKIAAQHEQIGGLLDVLGAAAVLRQSHAIAKDDSLGLHVDAGYPFDQGPRQARDTQDVIPGRAAQVLAQRVEAKCMLIDEGEIEHRISPRANGRFVRFENKLHHPLERRDVPAHPDLAIFAGDSGRAKRHHLDCVLRRGEPFERALAQWVHRHDWNAAPRRLVQGGVIMRGLYVPGFCPITKIASVLSKSSSRTVPLPMPMLSGRPTLGGRRH